MVNSFGSKVIATLLIATIVLSGCSATNTDIAAANDAGAMSDTAEASGANVDGNTTSTSNNTAEIMGLVTGIILVPLVLVWLADQQE